MFNLEDINEDDLLDIDDENIGANMSDDDDLLLALNDDEEDNLLLDNGVNDELNALASSKHTFDDGGNLLYQDDEFERVYKPAVIVEDEDQDIAGVNDDDHLKAGSFM